MTVDKIVKQFTKTLAQLETFISRQDRAISHLVVELENTETEKARAERIRNKLKEIVE